MGRARTDALDVTARLASLNDILEVTTKPILFDAGGGGDAQQFRLTVRTLERHGVSAAALDESAVREDQRVAALCNRTTSGKRAQITEEFMIVAGLDVSDSGGEAGDPLVRAAAYVEAGADALLLRCGRMTAAKLSSFCGDFRSLARQVPLFARATGEAAWDEAAMAEAGVKLVIYADHLLLSAYPAMREAAGAILRDGHARDCAVQPAPATEIMELIEPPEAVTGSEL